MATADEIGEPLIGSRLRMLWTWVADHAMEDLRSRGYDDLGWAHVQLFGAPSMHGRRPTAIAETMQITKQSVNELLAHLEAHGYLKRVVDPTDRRARIVRFTRRGRALERATFAAAHRAEAALANLVGGPRFRRLRADLDELVRLTATAPPAGLP